MRFQTSSQINQLVAENHCLDRFYKITILKNLNGQIGGYVLQPPIMDSPIPYLDCHGNPLTSFHIFDPDDAKAQAMRIIGPLREQFPIEESLDCADYSKSPNVK